MTCRAPATWLPRHALILLVVLLFHEVVMAMAPHDAEISSPFGDHGSVHGMHSADRLSHGNAPNDSIRECMSMKAARPGDTTRMERDHQSLFEVESRWVAAESVGSVVERDVPGVSAGQRRALLQVYLN